MPRITIVIPQGRYIFGDYGGLNGFLGFLDSALTFEAVQVDVLAGVLARAAGEDVTFRFFPPPSLVEYDIPVPGMETLALAPDLKFIETPPRLPPKLTPALLFPTFSLTPLPIFTLFLNRNPIKIPQKYRFTARFP